MGTAIVKKPLLTEKTMNLANHGFYTFVVDGDSRKRAIAREVARLYKVDVTNVRTVTNPGKERRVGKKLYRVRTPEIKKAIVRLKSGQKIAAFDISSEPEKK